jgi:hypothetical protein
VEAKSAGGNLDCSSIGARLVLDWCSIVPLILLAFSGSALRGAGAAPPSLYMALIALVCPRFKGKRIFLSVESKSLPG